MLRICLGPFWDQILDLAKISDVDRNLDKFTDGKPMGAGPATEVGKHGRRNNSPGQPDPSPIGHRDELSREAIPSLRYVNPAPGAIVVKGG